jgi:HicB family
MKRIIDGKTYNTDTSTVIARSEWTEQKWVGGGEEHHVGWLYQTRGGAFFLHDQTDEGEYDRDGDLIVRHSFEPMTRKEAYQWYMTGDVEVLNDGAFPEPPEAGDEDEAEAQASVYFRLPNALKRQIEAAAKDAGLSLNAWALRCFERCSQQEPGQ